MTLLEKTVTALCRCVPADTFAAAMAEVEHEEAAIKSVNTEAVDVTPVADPKPVIQELLTELGTPAHIKGYRYCVTGLLLVVNDPDVLDHITKGLYPDIAKIHGTTASRVERAIRHAVEVTWDRGDLDVLGRYFGNTVRLDKGKPTNAEFLAQMANIIRQKMKEV